MPADSWTESTLGEFVRLQRGHDLPESSRRVGDVPVMGSAGQNGFHDVARAKGPGVVIGRSGVGSMGVVSYSPTDYWPHNTVLYVTDFLGNDERFAYYFLNQLNLRSYDSGSAQSSLNRNYIYPIPVRVPPVSEQRRIGAIVGSLDDKIELNRKMNGTLEAIAQAIFKNWFVDFSPVIQQNGRLSNSNFERLFPSRFEDSPIGKVPQGWVVERVGDVVEFAYGKALKEEVRIPGDVPVYGSNGQIGWHNQALVDGPGVVIGRKGTPGVVTWVPGDFFPIDTTFYVVPKSECRSLKYLYHALKAQGLASLQADSAVPGLNRNAAYFNWLIVPPNEILDAFEHVVTPIFEKIRLNEKQGATLAVLRETLLPKLISGELRVRDAEKQLGAV